MCGYHLICQLVFGCLLLSWIFPIPLSRFACFDGCRWKRCFTTPRAPTDRGRSSLGRVIQAVVILSTVRYGEALNPGPQSDQQWSLGICNPSGLTSKTSALSIIPGDIWLCTESHLTPTGFRSLCKGMKALSSEYTYLVPGVHCPPRKSRLPGAFAGVLSISKFPARALPHSFPHGVMESSRVQVCGFSVGPIWVQAGLLYGFPDSPQYHARTYQTEVLLDALIDRLGLQADGVRIIGGDFNHSPEQLKSCARLRQLGFCELQEVASYRWGHTQCPTSRGPHVIDQLWLSREAQALLCGISLHEDFWSDHLAVEAHFSANCAPLQSFDWFMPSRFPRPENFQSSVVTDWTDPSLGYGMFWHQLEQSAAAQLQFNGAMVSPNSFGRGQTLSTTTKQCFRAPCKLGRIGSVQPLYHGASLLHGRWFRQLRRLQALSRMLSVDTVTDANREKICELWSVVRNATGFKGGFCRWWSDRFPASAPLGLSPPACEVALQMFQDFKHEVRNFERQLQAARGRHAKEIRSSQPNLIFKDCARDAPEVLDTLVQETVADVEQVDVADCSVILTQPVCLKHDVPVVIDGIPRSIMYAEADQIWLDSVDHIQPGSTARQQIKCTSDAAIIDAFKEVWYPRWNKASHVHESQWDQIVAFCQRTFAPIRWTYDCITPAKFRAAIAGKKRRSAIGPDGVSRADVLALSDDHLQCVCDLITQVEGGSAWPTQLVQGFVNSLSKGRGQWVDSYRPIVVYPIILRAWSSIRAREALNSLQPHLPESVKGGVPGGQSKDIWLQLSQMLESAQMHSVSLQGIVVDIQRAFNALPRWPIWALLACMDFPVQVVRAWSAFLIQQRRRFRVRASVSAGIASTTGFPEGCALSVFGMACVDLMLDAWLAAMTPPIRGLFTYVDDWHVVADNPEVLISAWEQLLSFTSVLDLTIDASKSFLWAALPSDRAALRNAPVKLTLASKSLGAHHNYCKRKGNRALVDRIDSLSQLWPRLRMSASPYHVKLRALMQVAWPRALFGVSIVCLGSGHYQRLRTGALRGLKCDRIGANPIAHLATANIWCDPEAWSTLQTCREMRELAGEDAMQAMLQWIGSGLAQVPQNGPAAILVQRCQRLGWSVTPQGFFRDAIGVFSIFHIPWDALMMRVKVSWPRVMSAELTHRPSFAGIQRAWLDEACRVLKGMTPQDQIYVRCAMDGTLYHEVTKEKSERGRHTVCVHCGCPDSVFHRLWQCEHFAECRQGFPWPSLLSQIPPALSCHAWPLLPDVWYEMQKHLCSLRSGAPAIVWPDQKPGQVFDVFTDGTCAHPTDAALRHSAWSISLASPSITMLDYQILAQGHTVGTLQTSFRAELEAMVLLLEAATRASVSLRVWCDCSAVVKGTRRLLAGGLVKPNRSHADLWQRVAACSPLLAVNQVRIVKVTSHIPCGNALDPVEEWAFWHNRVADEAAAECNRNRPVVFWNLWHRLKQSIESGRCIHAAVIQVILRVARWERQKNGEVSSSVNLPIVEPAPQSADVANELDGRRVRWSFTTKLALKYRYNNVSILHRWWTAVGVPALQSREPLVWLSGVQLYLDFYFSTLYSGMVSMVHSHWYDGDDVPPALRVGIGRKATMFLRVWNAYCRDNGLSLAHRMTRPQSGALWYWCMCWRLPWPARRLQQLDDALFAVCGRQIGSQKSLLMVDIPVPDLWPRV